MILHFLSLYRIWTNKELTFKEKYLRSISALVAIINNIASKPREAAEAVRRKYGRNK